MFPLMVLDDKVTVPPLTKTPPPCKQRANVSLPWGRWEVCRRGWHVHLPDTTSSLWGDGKFAGKAGAHTYPWKNKNGSQSNNESQIGHVSKAFSHRGEMGNIEHEHAHRHQLCWSRSGSSRLPLCHQRQRHRRPANNEQNVSLPLGRWELSRSLQYAPPVVDRSVGRSCASENQSKRVSNFPMGAMGTFSRSLRHVPTVVDRSVGCSCTSENQCKRVSNFPIGAMGSLQAWLARTPPW